ncbi:MAG TPA: Gfo/Idh/MocA family oxidoreductase [Ktedonobacteraceae bacterium]|jgi:predicted dehydrogenase
MKTLGIGAIGLHNHYHAYPMANYLQQGIEGARLVAVADERENYAEEFAKRYGAEASYKEYKALLERPDIDIVIITSYTSAHAEHCIAAAQAGKHILLDKPIATTMKDATRIVEAAHTYGVKLMMAYLLRFLPAYQRAKALIQEGVIGKPTSAFYSIRIPVDFIRDAPDAQDQGWYADPVKSGGGGFLDHGAHFADALRWFFDSDATSVYGKMGNLTYKDLPVEDYGICTASFADGQIGTIESSWHAAEWYGPMTSPDRCTISGTEGEIELHYQKSPQMEVASRLAPYTGRTYYDWVGEERSDICYKRIVEHMVQCVLEDKQPDVTGEDGRAALDLILAAYRSAREKREITLEK